MNRLSSRVPTIALLVFAGLLLPGDVKGAKLHVIVAADTNPAAGLGGDVLADRDSIEGLFRKHVPASQLNMTMLSAKQVTPDGILDAVRELKVVPSQDSVVFYYSGHGAYDETRRASDRQFLDLPKRGQLRRSQLTREMIKHEPRTAVLITDCCSAGRRFRGSPKAAPIKDKVTEISPLLNHLLFERSGYIDITSSQPGEYSLTRGDGKGSLFTYPFVKYVDDNADKKIPWRTLIRDVAIVVDQEFRRRVPKGIDRDGDGQVEQRTQTLYPFLLTPRLGMRVVFQNGRLVITEVLPLSPAFHAGLVMGDELVSINGQQMVSERDYDQAVDASPREMRMVVHDPTQGSDHRSQVTVDLNPN